jgi:iron-sulfur cluster assembly protein
MLDSTHVKHPPITITSIAINQVKTIMKHKNLLAEEYGLRVGIKGGGCGGASFLLGFDTPNATDDIYIVEGIRVFIEKKHLMYVLGMEINFEENEDGTGFVFNAPPKEA